MNYNIKLFLLLGMVLLVSNCADNEPDLQKDVDDITTTADITPYGGNLQVIDESGNIITLTFPPGALTDTFSVTLTILGTHMDLPIQTQHIRALEILPYDLSLYKAASISVKYSNAPDGIEKAALYRMHPDNRITPLGELNQDKTGSTVAARTLTMGKFAEGEMTLDQLNNQFSLLLSSLDISWKKGIDQPALQESQVTFDCSDYKDAWDNWQDVISGMLSFFQMRIILGYYDNLPAGGNTLDDDFDRLCENIAGKAISEVLDMGQPQDPCCRDYTHTIASMVETMMMLGCDQSAVSDRLSDRFNKVLNDCQSIITITSTMDIQAGGFVVETTGAFPITVLEEDESGTASVEGNGTLAVTGSAESEHCVNTVGGSTLTDVSGTRDAAYTYELEIVTEQDALLTSVCPDRTIETPLVGSGSRTVTLSVANGFMVTIEETIPEGSFTMDISLINPYTSMPGSK